MERLKNKGNNKEVTVVAYNKNKILGIAQISLAKWRCNHVGEFNISVRKEYRGFGLGKMLGLKVIELAKAKLKPKIIRLSVFAENKIAKGLYVKLGFKEVAVIPKQYQYKGKLVDEVVMILDLF
ncbi:MAG: GNAT family N-acetyltransferase [Candidatus Diapherotrites archaeon]